MQTQSIEAFVLKITPYLEKNLIVSLLTNEGARLNVFARNAKNSTKRFGGSLDHFNFIQCVLKFKEGDSLPELLEATSLEDLGLGEDIGRYAVYSFVAEIILEFLKESQAIPELYEGLRGIKGLIETSQVNLSQVLAVVESQLIRLFGYWPEWQFCGRCSAKTSFEGSHYLSPLEAILLCQNCFEKSGASQSSFMVIEPKLLKSFARETPLDEALAHRKRQILESLIQYILGKKMKSHAFLMQVLQ